MNDSGKKTLRHFYCRDNLWQIFETMSDDLDHGVDDLVNASMAAFAKEKGYLVDGARPPAPAVANAPVPPPQPRAAGVTPPPLPSPRHTSTRPSVPPQPPAPGGQATVDTPAPPLFLIFDNRKYRIDKEQFIIGRGAKSSDLPIRDGNISRKHVAVIRKNGAYYIKDLGSTNGIDYNGMRIDNKRIEEGDVYYLCDYQLRFTFQ